MPKRLGKRLRADNILVLPGLTRPGIASALYHMIPDHDIGYPIPDVPESVFREYN